MRGANVVGILSRSTFEHFEIFRNIEAHEPALAAAAATAHVAAVENWLRTEGHAVASSLDDEPAG